MNQRINFILAELSDIFKKVTIKDLSEQFGISQRTVRNDLNSINDMLNEYGLSPTYLEKGGVIIREEDFIQIIEYISEKDFYEYKLSKGERIQVASALIINSTEYITLSSIADSLFVSRATIVNDLPGIKSFLKIGNLEVISQPNKGLRIDGKESDKRRYLMKLASVDPDLEEQDMVAKNIKVQSGNKIILQKILTEQEHSHKSFLTDSSFQNILLYLDIMTDRNKRGEYIEVRHKKDNSKYTMAQDIIKYVSQYCQISSTEDEVQFLSEILQKAKYIKQKLYNRDAVKVQMIARRFIENICEELSINLNDDYDFFENLSNHLESIFTSEPPNLPDNLVVKRVIEENPSVAKAVDKMVPFLRQYMVRDIQENEIGYIAIHICAAIERKKNKEISFHVIVSCNGGIGTSRLLLEKLKKHFNFQIVDVVSAHEAKNLDKNAADFIITTVPLKGCKLDYVTVSPMLNDEDYIRVGNKIDTLRNSRNLPSRIETKEVTAKGMMEKIMPVIYEQVPEQANIIEKKLKKVVREYFKQNGDTDSDIFAPSLHHLLPPSHIEVGVKCKDWEDAVIKSAKKLLDFGYIEKRYISSMIENIKENGPYIVISPGFAIPHEGLDRGSVKVGMNLIILEEPVNFGEGDFDPVEFVCCMSTVDHKTHLKALFNLVNILKTEDFKERLRACSSSEEAAMVIQEYEYEVCD